MIRSSWYLTTLGLNKLTQSLQNSLGFNARLSQKIGMEDFMPNGKNLLHHDHRYYINDYLEILGLVNFLHHR